MRRLQLRGLSSSGKDAARVLYSKTLLLPETAFSPKLPTATERASLIRRSSGELYGWQKSRDGSRTFRLHDGPPYANGDLHLGHALNKILKDIVNRFEMIHNGSRIDYVPGWDCHGLPIEMKAIEKAGRLDAVETRKVCRELALLMIEKQKLQFTDFAIMTDFDHIYKTMSPEYESAQLRVFLKLFQNGLLSRQLKPVWWGCETQTALAEAELEYNPAHNSVAVYVKFPLVPGAFTAKYGEKTSLLIWTSTAWTIPANKAICINRNLQYTLLENTVTGEKVVVAAELANAILALDSTLAPTPVEFSGSELESACYHSPSSTTTETFPVLHGDHVSSSAGTGLVHNAPAHGMEDFIIGRSHGLQVDSLVDGKGLYVEANIPAGFRELAGKYANGKSSIYKVLKILEDNNMLFHVTKKYTHSYPYDWRSKTPVIQRATQQWFVNVDKIKEPALILLNNVEFVPEAGRNRLTAFVSNRNEWCISRQRSWGVPLPMVYNKETHAPLEDPTAVSHIVARLGELGTDEWFVHEKDISRWLPESLDGTKYYKGMDTMDVWFDSGTSWTTLLKDDSEFAGETPLADVYLEGSDQHRGWFQSSLLNKIIASGDGTSFKAVAPFKKIITHGFTLDKQNAKMSKSLGNTILPTQVIEGGGKPLIPALGTDGLRLWVASSSYTLDVSVSAEVLKRVLENVRKLRVTFKYLLGNLGDYVGPVSYDELSPLDKWTLTRLRKLEQNVIEAYASHNYARVVREINTHVSSDLSAIFFDISKDCLYTDAANSARRRGVQTVLMQVLKTYVGLLAPIQPVTTQEVWDNMSDVLRPAGAASPFMLPWSYFSVPEHYCNNEIEAEFEPIWSFRDTLYKKLEELRVEGKFKNKLEAEIVLEADNAVGELFEKHAEYLDDYFLVSKVKMGGLSSGERFSWSHKLGQVSGVVQHSSSCKCPRCWKYVAEAEGQLCGRCESVTCK